MDTEHDVIVGDSRNLSSIEDESVELVVTSPPYPMIEMWDEAFTSMDSDIKDALEDNPQEAFERMHDILDEVWQEVERTLVDGGIACINIGDATRTLNGDFQVYPNHARIIQAFRDLGFSVLPDILWRKPTNSLAKFMGSGTMPPNAYVTLEHEYILILRKGSLRSFKDSEQRRDSAYFWEERNDWFSDVWTDIPGITQQTHDKNMRERSAAYPLTIPYRLINMYSVQGETVLDPFLGTGTTTAAAMCSARNSIGVDIDPDIITTIESRVDGISSLSRDIAETRIQRHRDFFDSGDHTPKYTNQHYDTPVMTKAEQDLQFWEVAGVTRTDDQFRLTHHPVEQH